MKVFFSGGIELKQEIIIAVFTSVLSLLLNWRMVHHELKKSKKEKINESRIPLYIECYGILERNIADKNAVFQKDFIDQIIKLKVKMKLLASNNVLQPFKKYCNWVFGIFNEYSRYCREHDPSLRFHIDYTEDGSEIEVPDFTEQDLDYWGFLDKQYIQKRNIDQAAVRSKTQDILNAMRNDLGNDIFIDDFIH